MVWDMTRVSNFNMLTRSLKCSLLEELRLTSHFIISIQIFLSILLLCLIFYHFYSNIELSYFLIIRNDFIEISKNLARYKSKNNFIERSK